MKKLFNFVVALLFSASLYADETGTITLFTFLNDTPLKNSEIIIDAKESYFTDEDGSNVIFASVGAHQVEVISKNSKGENIGYVKKSVLVKTDKDTQFIVTFNSLGAPTLEIDVPLDSGSENIDINSLAKATLNGFVFSSETKKGIANARVFVKGTPIDARTDENGSFSVSVPADVNVSLSVVHSEYSAQTLNNVQVKKDETGSVKVELTPASMELEEFIVLAPQVEGSVATIMAEEKKSNAIANILGSEEMSKKGDSSAAGALKRVTGVTLIGGKTIYVRGLGDRYSNVEMNSMPLPSPNPTKRVVPLDIFPSGVIKSMKVQKSATADIPSSFGGGYVDIRTKDSSKDDYVKVSLGLKASSFTGDEVYTYEGSSTDFLGFDDGYRAIASEVLSGSKLVVGELRPSFTEEQEKAYTKEMVNRKLTAYKEALAPNFSLSFEGANNYDLQHGHKVTLFGNYKYSQEHTYRQENYYTYDYDIESDQLKDDPRQYGTHDISSSTYSHSAIFNLGYSFYDAFKVKYTKLLTHNAEKLTRVSSGIAGSNDADMTRYNLNWEERTLNVDQINAEMKYQIFNKESEFKMGLENAVALLDQPGNYKYAFNNEADTPYLDRGAANIFLNLNTEDELSAMYLKNTFHFDLVGEDEQLEIGYSLSSKSKVYGYNKYELIDTLNRVSERKEYLIGTIDEIYDAYVRSDSPPSNDYFKTTINSLVEDPFNAQVDDSSLYFMTLLKPSESFNVSLGARYVDYEQSVYKLVLESISEPITQEERSLKIQKLFPSMGLKYKFNKDNHFDFAYSQTYIVPDLREFTDSTYFHPYEVADVVGNPELKNTIISNYDLKFSHYFSDTENVKIGAFYKYLDKPIEDNVLASSSLTRYSFHNADSATLMGVELDGRKNLDFVNALLRNYYVSGNFSYTSSKVTLTPEQEENFSSHDRELQGLSPMVLNLSAAYDKDDRSITASFNYMSERIRKVGLIEDGYKKFPDDVEVPANLLDLVWIEKFDDSVSMSAKLGNILDEETVWKQGDNITKSFRKGRTFSLKLSYKY